MSRAVLEVRQVGPLVSYQDGGRPGAMRFGVPVSGPMDRLAHTAANVVVGRPATATAVEVSVGGLVLVAAVGSVTVAVCGGGFDVVHGRERCAPWSVCTLRQGDELSIAAGRWGSWCYLAVAGDLAAHRFMGSTATHVRSGLGGGLLRVGDQLVVEHATAQPDRDGPVEVPPGARTASRLRVVPGPQAHCFVPGAVDALLGGGYRLTPAGDRMGVRLDGPRLELADALGVPSAPVVRGSIQVAGDGVPTLLFADHQTTGGYPRIATVIDPDVDRAARLRPGDPVEFVAIDPESAVLAARATAAEHRRAVEALAERPGVRSRRLLSVDLVGGVVDTEASHEPPGGAASPDP